MRSSMPPLRAFAAIALLPLLAACGDQATSATAMAERLVQVQRVAFQSEDASREYVGVVRARYETDLGFRVAGKITARTVSVGDRVNAGDVIARLDPQDLTLQAESALPTNAAHFSQLLITRETQQNPRAPGAIVLQPPLEESLAFRLGPVAPVLAFQDPPHLGMDLLDRLGIQGGAIRGDPAQRQLALDQGGFETLQKRGDIVMARIVIEHLIQDALVLPIIHRREDTVRPLIEFIDCDVA